MRLSSLVLLTAPFFLACFDLSFVANGIDVNCTSQIDYATKNLRCNDPTQLLRFHKKADKRDEERVSLLPRSLGNVVKSLVTRVNMYLNVMAWKVQGKTPKKVFDQVFQYDKEHSKTVLYADLRQGLENPKLSMVASFYAFEGKTLLIDELMKHYDDKVLAYALSHARKSEQQDGTHREITTLFDQYFEKLIQKERDPQTMFVNLGIRESGVQAFVTPAIEVLSEFIVFYNRKVGSTITLLSVLKIGFGTLRFLAPILAAARSWSHVAATLQREVVQTFVDEKYTLENVFTALDFKNVKATDLFRSEYLDTLDKFNRLSGSKDSLLESLKKGFGDDELAPLLAAAKKDSLIARSFQKELVEGYVENGYTFDDVVGILKLKSKKEKLFTYEYLDTLDEFVKLSNANSGAKMSTFEELRRFFDNDSEFAILIYKATQAESNTIAREFQTKEKSHTVAEKYLKKLFKIWKFNMRLNSAYALWGKVFNRVRGEEDKKVAGDIIYQYGTQFHLIERYE